MGVIGKIAGAVKNFFSGVAEDAFASAGAAAYIASAAAIAAANTTKLNSALDDDRKQLLRPDMGPLVDDVRVTYDAQLVELRVMGKSLGTNADAQTFGQQIYVQGRYKPGDTDQLRLLAHEITHAKQFRSADGNPFKFGFQYFREYYRAGFDYDDNVLELEADRFADCFIIRSGSSVQHVQTWKSNWTTGWSSIMPFRIGQDVFALLYKAGSGETKVVKIRSTADGVDEVWNDTWTKGWSTFMPFVLNGTPHYLAYKVAKGTVAIDRIRPGGAGVDTLWSDKWTTGWTTFMPFVLGGRPHYLVYKEGTGSAAIHAIKANGTGVDEIWKDKWTKGWTSFMPFVHNTSPHYLAYKREKGTVHIDRVKAGGNGYQTVWTGDWSAGWTDFVPLSANGKTFLAYKGMHSVLGMPIPGNGVVHVSDIAADAKGTEPRWCAQWRGSWACVTSFALGGAWHTLLYGADGNDVHIDRFVP